MQNALVGRITNKVHELFWSNETPEHERRINRLRFQVTLLAVCIILLLIGVWLINNKIAEIDTSLVEVNRVVEEISKRNHERNLKVDSVLAETRARNLGVDSILRETQGNSRANRKLAKEQHETFLQDRARWLKVFEQDSIEYLNDGKVW
jgi:hypothetical protein